MYEYTLGNYEFALDRWYNIRISINNYDMKLYINDALVKTVQIGTELELNGDFIIQTHNEIYLDDFSITGTALKE